ncbi:hypothetical protein CLU79DRAFT_771760 [Phycomyces nitens]|nr:hypothetical protein CLU79DRAFT_771760 [Phycomyces nitens]
MDPKPKPTPPPGSHGMPSDDSKSAGSRGSMRMGKSIGNGKAMASNGAGTLSNKAVSSGSAMVADTEFTFSPITLAPESTRSGSKPTIAKTTTSAHSSSVGKNAVSSTASQSVSYTNMAGLIVIGLVGLFVQL